MKLRRQNVLVVLSPYFFPLWGFSALGIGLLVRDSFQAVWNLLPFFLFGNFTYRLASEFRWYQQDLAVYGRVFSSLLVFLLLLCSFTVIMGTTHTLDWEWVKQIGPNLLATVTSLQGGGAGDP